MGKIGASNLAGKVIVLTGAAGQLGRVICADLGRRGAQVRATDCRNAAGIWPLVCDVTNLADVRAMGVMILREAVGEIDGLVCLHGLDAPPTTEASDPWRSWEAMLDVNLTGTANACRVFGPLMFKQGGSIVNMASLYGIVAPDQRLYSNGFVKPAAYSASKAGVIGLTRYLAALWGAQGVRVNALVLGGVWTPETPSSFQQAYCARVPLGRMAEPKDAANAIAWLLSDESAYVTGSVLRVDGGATAQF